MKQQKTTNTEKKHLPRLLEQTPPPPPPLKLAFTTFNATHASETDKGGKKIGGQRETKRSKKIPKGKQEKVSIFFIAS